MRNGKVAIMSGHGGVGKGCVASMKVSKARIIVTEIDHICVVNALIEGLHVVTLEYVVSFAKFFVATTGNKDIILLDHIRKMRNNALVVRLGVPLTGLNLSQ